LNLNVFEKFDPKIPESYKKTKYICSASGKIKCRVQKDPCP